MKTFALASLFWLGACGGDERHTGPCAGVDCSGHGDCIVEGSSARCNCDDGYVALGLSCSEGGDSDSDVDTDADTDTDTDVDTDADTDTDTGPGPCDPVTQEGCDAGQKCTYVTTGDPPVVATGCVDDGSVSEGEACLFRKDGADDCAAGLVCISAACVPICTVSPDSCAVGSACQVYGGMFDDRPGVGACVETCDPLAQDCTDGTDACYVVPFAGYSTCERPHAEGTQGDACTYVNDCARGYGCIVPSAPEAPDDACTQFCDTSDGNPACPNVDPPLQCYSLQLVRGKAVTPDPTIGVCLDPLVWPDL